MGSTRQHCSVQIPVKLLLKEELLKPPAPALTPQLSTFISSITGVFFLRAAPRAAPGGALLHLKLLPGGDE